LDHAAVKPNNVIVLLVRYDYLTSLFFNSLVVGLLSYLGVSKVQSNGSSHWHGVANSVAGALVVKYVGVRILSPNYDLLPNHPDTAASFGLINIGLADKPLEGRQGIAILF
jgi:hypothetical protein